LGVLDRPILSDGQWARISAHIIGDERTRGQSGRDNRMFVEAVLWIVRTGSPWRDLPEIFGCWNTSFRRFSRWNAKGIWQRIFAAMSDDPDFEYLVLDSSIVPAHPHAAGAQKGLRIGPSPRARRPEHQDPSDGARSWLPGSDHPQRAPTEVTPRNRPPRLMPAVAKA
jgi:putative transposase